MKRDIILVTGVGGDIGQGVLKCLKNTGRKFRIIGCDVDSYAAGKDDVNVFFHSPWAYEGKKYLNFIKKITKNERVEYILPTTEPEIEIYNAQRDYFKSERINVLINSPCIVETFLDKYNTAQFLKDKGFQCPKTFLLESFTGGLSFPALLKTRKGYGAKRVIKVENIDELEFYKRKIDDGIIQELVGSDDEEYTIGVFSDGCCVHSIIFKRVLGYGSLSKVAELVKDSYLTDLSNKVARAIDLKGSINIQARKNKDRYAILEINPRFSSTVYVRHYFGFKDVEWWLDLFENKQFSYRQKYASGIAVRKMGEVFFDCSTVE